MNRIHALPVAIDGNTHIEEGQLVLRRGTTDSGENEVDTRMEVRGGTLAGSELSSFQARTATGRPTQWEELPESIPGFRWTAARRADWVAYQDEFEEDPNQPYRILEERLPACFLMYMQLVQMGMRPVEEPEEEELMADPTLPGQEPPEVGEGPPVLQAERKSSKKK